jgi:hypothetical protein
VCGRKFLHEKDRDSSSLKVREEGEEKDEHLMHKFKK